jgi:hypothetical protein
LWECICCVSGKKYSILSTDPAWYLACLINGTEHKGAISNIRLLADDLSINDATIKVDARWCRANMNRFLPAICAFARKSPANAGIQVN